MASNIGRIQTGLKFVAGCSSTYRVDKKSSTASDYHLLRDQPVTIPANADLFMFSVYTTRVSVGAAVPTFPNFAGMTSFKEFIDSVGPYVGHIIILTKYYNSNNGASGWFVLSGSMSGYDADSSCIITDGLTGTQKIIASYYDGDVTFTQSGESYIVSRSTDLRSNSLTASDYYDFYRKAIWAYTTK